jgi:hypothetical protein
MFSGAGSHALALNLLRQARIGLECVGLEWYFPCIGNDSKRSLIRNEIEIRVFRRLGLVGAL